MKRDIKERKALFRGLISSLVLKGKIKTTEAKAKAIKGQIDKLVSRAKKSGLTARRQLLTTLDKGAVERLLNDISPRFSGRSSGFTQMIKLGPRKGDNAPLVLLQWVGLADIQREEEKKPEVKKPETATKDETKEKKRKNVGYPEDKKIKASKKK